MDNRIKIVMIIALISLVSCASAQTVSFADPDSAAHKDVYMYNSSGILLGSYNTTSTGINVTPYGDVFFVLKPQYSNPLDDPVSFLEGFIGWVQTNALFLIIIGMVGSLLFVRRF